MTPKEAEELGLPGNQHWRYTRVSSGKENYAPPPDRAIWFRLESISLGNPDLLYIEGDNLQVVTSWTPPSAFEGLKLDVIARIFDELRQEPTPGEFYSPDQRGKRWAGRVFVKYSGKTEAEAGRILATWVKHNVLIRDKYDSHESKGEVARVTLNEVKAAAILGPLYRSSYDE
jgi:hypothetical protein